MSIKEQIHDLSDEMITNIGRLVAIDSQLGMPGEGKPFGEGPAEALKEGLKIAEELGFKTVNLDNYCGYAEMGEGEEIVGIAGHLDIVPVGGDWTYDPFKLTREGDYIYGRGTTDDKGPVIEALYAMKLLRDSGVKLNKRVRLIMGCNEETGSKCMEHYNEVEEELSCGFTPDANFPCIHGEKGYMSMMAYSKNTRIISMNGGFVSNAVCDNCTTVIPAEAGLKEKLEQMLSETKLQEYKVTETRSPFMQKVYQLMPAPRHLVSTQQVLPWNVLQRQASKTILLNFIISTLEQPVMAPVLALKFPMSLVS